MFRARFSSAGPRSRAPHHRAHHGRPFAGGGGTAPVDTTLYTVLGVTTSASGAELKKAYHDRARVIHPDRNRDDPNANDRFKELQEAYEILTDSRLRNVYDQAGLVAVRREQQRQSNAQQRQERFATSSSPFGGGDATFFQMPGGFAFRFGSEGFTFEPQRPQERPIVRDVLVTLEQLYAGEPLEVRVPVRMRDGSTTERAFRFQFDSFRDFARDGGVRTARMRGRGNESSDPEHVLDGDVVLRFRLEPHEQFQPVNSHDLLLRRSVSLAEALGGVRFEVEHVDSARTVLQFRTQQGDVVRPGDVYRVAGKGLSPQGDLYVRFDVQFPERLEPGPALSELCATLRRITRRTGRTAADRNDDGGGEGVEGNDRDGVIEGDATRERPTKYVEAGRPFEQVALRERVKRGASDGESEFGRDRDTCAHQPGSPPECKMQ